MIFLKIKIQSGKGLINLPFYKKDTYKFQSIFQGIKLTSAKLVVVVTKICNDFSIMSHGLKIFHDSPNNFLGWSIKIISALPLVIKQL